MRIIRQQAYARAALVGNPSDGYGGKTLAMQVANFAATVTLYEWDELELLLSQQDKSRFASLDDLVRDVELHGYYGGIRLVKATIRKFAEYCRRQGFHLHDGNFAVRYETNVPRQVGLAGSSAIVVATLKALTAFYGVDVDRDVFPSLALAVENDELGISAGLQDRVVQAWGGLVYMDFSPDHGGEKHGYRHGRYEALSCDRLPPLYLAYLTTVSKSSDSIHLPLRQRFLQGDPQVLAGMRRLAALTEEARGAVLRGDWDELGRLIDATFDARRSTYEPAPRLVEMVERARAAGASANFAGSGGAIVGTYPDEAAFERLRASLASIGCSVVKPIVKKT